MIPLLPNRFRISIRRPSWVFFALAIAAPLAAAPIGPSIPMVVDGGFAMVLFAATLGTMLTMRRKTSAPYKDSATIPEPAISATRFMAALRASPDPVLLLDDQASIVAANARAVAVYGATESELSELAPGTLNATLPSDETERYLALLASGENNVFETIHRRSDGGAFAVEISATVCEFTDGRHLLLICRDLSRREAEARNIVLGTALESAPNAVAITDPKGFFTWVNPAFVRTTGYPLEELVGQSARFLKSGHHPNAFYAEMWRTISKGETWRGETVNRRKNGDLYIEDTTIVPVHDAAGGVLSFVSIRQDITGRKGAERRVREQAALLDKASEAIVVADLSHRVTFWNRGAERLFGASPADTLGHSLETAFALDRTVGQVEFHHAISVAQDWRGEIRGHDRQGQPCVIETSITMLRDDAGRPTGRLCISSDATRKKALEEQFLRVQRMENLGMLAAGIAHDLNNILAPMRMVGPLLRDRVSEPRDIRLLDTLESCASRGAGLVRQILGFAQGVAGEHRLVQVKHLLHDITDVVAASFPNPIVLEDDIPGELWPITGNPTQIHQVLLNLCVNARDAMPHGGILRLHAMNCLLDDEAAGKLDGARPGPWLVLQVEDTGTGIPPDVLARIWEPLFTTKAPDRGTGLGLSTVRGIVAHHHGFVTVQTTPGRGTTFRVHLPVDESAAGSDVTLSPIAAAPAHGQQILFVDDEPSICELVKAVLSRHGYRVLTARDGSEAVAQFAPRIADIALVITDLDMPNLDGAALCRVIKALSPETRILATSGFSTAAPAGLPPDAFTAKPFSTGDLLRKVEQVLNAGIAGAASPGGAR